jgi:predicted nucleotidyltransferase
MLNRVYSIKEIRDCLAPVFEHYNISRAILFGSYGKKNADEDSDIDILVDSSLKGLHFIGLLNDVREAVGKEVDLFDVSHINAGERLDTEIRNTGVLIYEK